MAKTALKMYDNEKMYQELFEDYIALIKIHGMAEETIRKYIAFGLINSNNNRSILWLETYK